MISDHRQERFRDEHPELMKLLLAAVLHYHALAEYPGLMLAQGGFLAPRDIDPRKIVAEVEELSGEW